MKKMQYICKSNSNDCTVTTHNRRRSCRACRFQRCMKIGMNPDICLNKIGPDSMATLSGHDKIVNLYKYLPSIFRESFQQFWLTEQHDSTPIKNHSLSSNLNTTQHSNSYIIIEFVDFYIRICSSLINFVAKFDLFQTITPSLMWKIIHDEVSYFASCLFIACYWSSVHITSSELQLPYIPQLQILSLGNIGTTIPEAVPLLHNMIQSVNELDNLLVCDIPHAIFSSLVKNLNEFTANSEINEYYSMMNAKRWTDSPDTWHSLSRLISDSHQVAILFKNLFINYDI